MSTVWCIAWWGPRSAKPRKKTAPSSALQPSGRLLVCSALACCRILRRPRKTSSRLELRSTRDCLMKNLKARLFSLALSLAALHGASAEVRFPNLLSDHAVLQRERPIHVWGWATPNAHLTVRFHQQTVGAEADALGQWSAYLAPEDAGGPFTLSVTGDGPEKTLSDLLIGDVWFASGQSNMEMPLNGFPPQ